jgi:cytochrome c biogenesis protein CcmG/thiol:disulfide interchange protein DsbE
MTDRPQPIRWPLIPLAVFVVVAAFLAVGLGLNPREVPSPFIGKPAPAFLAPQMLRPELTFSPKDMLGRVWLLNFWASWCPPCREEHPLLVELARSQGVAIVGINYKDDPARATAWLKQLGDPYVATVADPDGRIGIDFGVYGMPETFLIDRTGVIRYKRIGAITRERLEGEILPLLKKLHAS